MDRYILINVESTVTGEPYDWTAVVDTSWTPGSSTPMAGRVVARFFQYEWARAFVDRMNGTGEG